MTHYQVLELSEGASFAEIKKNYRRLVKRYHPDLNPSAQAAEKIVKLTEAYGVLSDPIQRQQYDWSLQIGADPAYQATHAPPPPPDEYELKKQEYLKRRRAQEQRQWEQIFKMKVRFYKAQRYFAFIFLIVAGVYSYDYFFTDQRGGDFEIKKMGLNRWGNCGVSLGSIKFQTSQQFYYDVSELWQPRVQLHYSVLHNIPVAVSVEGLGIYRINGTLHTYNNFFSYMLLFLGLLLIFRREYQDWLLTLGLVPFFIVAFLLLLSYFTTMGML